MLDEQYPNSLCEVKGQASDIVTRLKGRKLRLETDLARVNEALEALEANPEVARVLKLVSAATN